MRVWLNIGSNIGDSRALVAQAVAALLALPGVGEAMVSDPVESDPWGYTSPHRFVNVGVSFETAMAAPEVLRRALAVERAISAAPHRDPSGAYIDRLIDVDLIAAEGVRCATESLQLPHPRAAGRAFVMVPLLSTLPLLPPLW